MSRVDTPIRPARSLLRRARMSHVPRPRFYRLRLVVTAIVCGSAGVFVWMVATRRFSRDGPESAIYWLHDMVYLPVKGMVWTAVFPYALLWLVPLVVFAAAIAIEGLLGIGVIRSVHRWMIILLMRHEPGRRIVALGACPPRKRRGRDGQDGLRHTEPPPGFAARVVAEMHAGARFAVAAGVAASEEIELDRRSIDRLTRLAHMELVLAGPRPDALVAVLDSAALVGLSDVGLGLASERLSIHSREGSSPESALPARVIGEFANAFERVTTDVDRLDAEQRHRLRYDTLAAAASLGAHPTVVGGDAALLGAGLAARYLGVLQPGIRAGFEETTQILRAWTDARARPPAPELGEAMEWVEASIQIEFWAQLAERSTAQAPADGLLASVLDSEGRTASLGEVFAWEGPRR